MNFTGTIIEESLEDKSVLDDIKIVSTKVKPVTEKYQTPWVKQWTLDEVEISEEQAGEIAEKLSKALDRKHNWYADYKNDQEHYIIYKDRVFHVTDRSDQAQYQDATDYGVSLGIPDYQVDFSPHVKK